MFRLIIQDFHSGAATAILYADKLDKLQKAYDKANRAIIVDLTKPVGSFGCKIVMCKGLG